MQRNRAAGQKPSALKILAADRLVSAEPLKGGRGHRLGNGTRRSAATWSYGKIGRAIHRKLYVNFKCESVFRSTDFAIYRKLDCYAVRVIYSIGALDP